MSTITTLPKGGFGRDAFMAAKVNAGRLVAAARGVGGKKSMETARTGFSQADMLDAILREFPRWASTSMAVPHLMKFLKDVSDRGVQLESFDVEAEPAREGMSAILSAVVSGRDADGVMQHRVLPLAQVYGVVGFELPPARVRGPVTYTSEATARDFAGIPRTAAEAEKAVSRRGAEAQREAGGGGACDATGEIPGVEAGVPGAAAPASAMPARAADEGEE